MLQNVEYQDVGDCPKYYDEAPGESSSSVQPRNIYNPSSSLNQQHEMSALEDCGTFRNFEAIKNLEREEGIEVDIGKAQTATQIGDDNLISTETSNAILKAKMKESSNTALTNPNEGRATAARIATEGPSDVFITPSRFYPPLSSETLPSSVSLLSTIYAAPPEVDPLMEEYSNFRDIGSIKKKHILLLEEAIAKYPSLWTWHETFKRPHMKRSGYISLGDMLEFLASTRWGDLTEDKKAEFESLVHELDTFSFDIQWLEKTHAMIKGSKFDEETIGRVKMLEAQVMEQETEMENLLNHVQIVKMKLDEIKSELDAIRGEIGNFNDLIGF